MNTRISEPLESAREIWELALSEHKPYAVVLALSGGDDSRAAYFAAKAIGIKLDYIVHINTRTGIPQTTEWVRWFASEYANLPYIEADAGTAYADYVKRKGFFGRGTGRGNSAHSFAFHKLKSQPLTHSLSIRIRQRKRNRKILLINGARLSESENRNRNFSSTPVRADRLKPDGTAASSNIWVNLLQHWVKSDCQAICEDNRAPRNPVSVELCRSAECMCGTTQSKSEFEQAAAIYPCWAKKMRALDDYARSKFGFGWGEEMSEAAKLEIKGQMRLFDDDFQPLCSTCLENASHNLTEPGAQWFHGQISIWGFVNCFRFRARLRSQLRRSLHA